MSNFCSISFPSPDKNSFVTHCTECGVVELTFVNPIHYCQDMKINYNLTQADNAVDEAWEKNYGSTR